ncbi:MAG: sigma-70 family RNA polymerase sigma factor [Planctomycetota bacterium]|nr:sigma-70 family RNA polymerase sigma factor [Planctomycetota bacterium]
MRALFYGEYGRLSGMQGQGNGEYESMEDGPLGEAAAAGDRRAVETLLERHHTELHAFIRLRYGKLLSGRESSIDLVQSVCREVLEQADRFQWAADNGFRRWLFTTALRKINDRRAYYLAGKRDVFREIPESVGDEDGESASLMQHYRTFSTPSRVASHREEVERIEAAFDLLTEEQREVVTLAHLADLPRADIAAQLGKTEGAVRVILHRALAKLSSNLTS